MRGNKQCEMCHCTTDILLIIRMRLTSSGFEIGLRMGGVGHSVPSLGTARAGAALPIVVGHVATDARRDSEAVDRRAQAGALLAVVVRRAPCAADVGARVA